MLDSYIVMLDSWIVMLDSYLDSVKVPDSS